MLLLYFVVLITIWIGVYHFKSNIIEFEIGDYVKFKGTVSGYTYIGIVRSIYKTDNILMILYVNGKFVYGKVPKVSDFNVNAKELERVI